MELPAELQARIDEAITQYPVSKRSAALPLLHLVQEHYGYIEDEAIDWVAARLGLEPINVLELVTFYPMFRRFPAAMRTERRSTFHVTELLNRALGGQSWVTSPLSAAMTAPAHNAWAIAKG